MRRLIALFLFLWTVPAQAVVISRLYDFQPHTKIQAEQVDAEFDNILSAVNGNLDAGNMSALGQQISTGSGPALFNSTNETLVTNLNASIVVKNRPVWVGLQSTDPYSPGRVYLQHNGGGATGNAGYISFHADLVTRNQVAIGTRLTTATTVIASYPCSTFWFLDTPTPSLVAHSYTVYARIASADSGMLAVENCKLVVFEL